MTLTEQAIATIAAGCEGVTEGRVKPLEWSEPSSPNTYCSYDHVFAGTPFGRYQIEWKSWKDYPSFVVDLAGEVIAVYPGETLESARAVAQADYEQRILSALIAPPAIDPATVLALCALAQEALQSRREGQQMREAVPVMVLPKAFITCNSNAPDYWVSVKTSTLKGAQLWHDAICALGGSKGLKRWSLKR